MKEYLIYFIQVHLDFRLPEFESLCATFNIPYEILGKLDKESPFLRVKLPSSEAAIKIASRAILVRGIYEIWGEGKDYEELKENITKYQKDNFEEHQQKYGHTNWTFRVKVEGYGRKYSQEKQREIMLFFAFMGILENGKVFLKNPDYVFSIVEEVGENLPNTTPPKRVFFLRDIAEGVKGLIDLFDVKKRPYIGTTSMDSALSLLVANMAKADVGKFMFDPFVGTGSLLLTCSHFGVVTLGADLDPRVLRGKKGKNVFSNYQHFKLMDKSAGLLINDNSKLDVWREGEIFDAIVCDPPYGVRAGARKVGKKAKNRNKPRPDELDQPHIPQCVPYPINDVILDLLHLAARTLTVSGRCVYWLPTTNEFKESDLPRHPCLKLLSNSEQVLTWTISRRLIVMEKIIAFDPLLHDIDLEEFNKSDQSPAHTNFPIKYYAGTSANDLDLQERG